VTTLITGTVTDPQRAHALMSEEVTALASLQAEGVIVGAYRSQTAPQFTGVSPLDDLDELNTHLRSLPFIRDGIMTLTHQTVVEL